jgi:hypothetical protein
MAAYKTLNSQDIIISPLVLTKGFRYEGNQLTASNVDVARYLGDKFGTDQSTGFNNEYSQSSVYFSIQQLYYSNYISSSNGEVQIANTESINTDGTVTGRIASNAFYNYPQTDLNPYKYFPTSSYAVLTGSNAAYGTSKYGQAVYGQTVVHPTIGIMSISKAMFGDYILPNSLLIITDSGSYFDDGEGRLKRDCPLITSSIYVGNVIYEHGMIIFTGGTRTEGTGEYSSYGTSEYGAGLWGGRSVGESDILNFVTGSNITMSFSSSFTMYETQYKCTITEDDFNYSQNPSILSGSTNSGVVYDFATGSYFGPYVTTVGLYNNNYELVAVGKLAQPLPTTQTTDTTILVNIDRQ